jgi:hypothetical protein
MIGHRLRANRPKSRIDDHGLSLIELVVYLLVSTLVLAGLATIFAAALTNDARTRERDTATGMAQLITNSVQTSVRNAVGAPVVSEGGMLLRARVAVGSSGWECRGWVLDGDELKYRASAGAIAPHAYAEGDGWTTLAKGVVAAGPAGAAFVAQSARSVALHLEVTVGAATVPVTSGATAQGAGSDAAGGSAACVA